MKISLSERFQSDIISLSDEQKTQVISVMLKVPKALKQVHQHSGLGLRKIHPSGIYEARLGLGLRMIFGIQSGDLFFHRVGNHDDIQKYLKGL